MRVMFVLALSTQAQTLQHVERIFSDQIAGITSLTDVPQFVDSARSGKWTVFVVDHDLLKSQFEDPLDFIRQLPPDAQFIFIGSHNFCEWHEQLRTAGAIVLHKPNTVGEFGIALRKLAADSTRRKQAS